SGETQISYRALECDLMNRRNLTISTKTLIILFAIIGSVNILVSTATLSPVFSIASTSPAQDPFLRTSTAQDISIILKGIQELLSPSGYEQAREDPSYAINIPFSELGFTAFEPSDISIPANMGVIWFNDDDSPHSVTFNDTNSPEAIDPGTIAPGGFFIHKFSTPGTYDYYDDQNPQSKGRIHVGAEFESGQYMNMLVGGDALPFEAGKVGRTTFSFVPHDNVTTIPPSLSITYNVAIADSTGTQLYSGQFDDSDGILDLELIPSSRSLSSSSNQTTTTTTSSSSNQTASNFVTWGPDLTDQQGVASDGAYHVQGPVLTENEDYTITVSITSIDDTIQTQPPSDDFLLPSVNSTGTS
ncbi:MAG: cupredoxin domain-containing protein, partial [Nitrososphaeraceae archaeon]